MKRLILASGSPRRREIMASHGHEFIIIKAEGDEYSDAAFPGQYVSDLSRDKGMEVLGKVKDKLPEGFDADDCIYILSADTVVAVDNDILGKPENRADAIKMIKRIADRSHSVYTGVTIVRLSGGEEKVHTFYDETKVFVKHLTDAEIEAYVDLGECMDKAGAYAIQGGFGPYIDHIEGDYTNVVGLPYEKVYDALKELDY